MPREAILIAFSEWTAFSATRSGCPLKSRESVYPLIRIPRYDEVIYGDRINCGEFDAWHETNTKAICNADNRLPIGWAAKLINVYLKTRVYIAGEGRIGLVECIHPPIDNGLWNGVRQAYHNNPTVINNTHIVNRIKEIITYEIYRTIIDGFQLIAQDRGCLLIEVEELWQGTMTRNDRQTRIRNPQPIVQDLQIPINLLDGACQLMGELPRRVRGIKISRELIRITMEIQNAAPDKTLPQNCRNATREDTPDGLDKRIKVRCNDDLRRANIISDVLAEAGIVEIIQIENPRTGKMIKGTRLLGDWCW